MKTAVKFRHETFSVAFFRWRFCGELTLSIIKNLKTFSFKASSAPKKQLKNFCVNKIRLDDSWIKSENEISDDFKSHFCAIIYGIIFWFFIFFPSRPRSSHSIGFCINGKVNLNILFVLHGGEKSERSWMKRQKACRNPPATVILTWYLSHFMFICHCNFFIARSLGPRHSCTALVLSLCVQLHHTNNIVLLLFICASLVHASN